MEDKSSVAARSTAGEEGNVHVAPSDHLGKDLAVHAPEEDRRFCRHHDVHLSLVHEGNSQHGSGHLGADNVLPVDSDAPAHPATLSQVPESCRQYIKPGAQSR